MSVKLSNFSFAIFFSLLPYASIFHRLHKFDKTRNYNWNVANRRAGLAILVSSSQKDYPMALSQKTSDFTSSVRKAGALKQWRSVARTRARRAVSPRAKFFGVPTLCFWFKVSKLAHWLGAQIPALLLVILFFRILSWNPTLRHCVEGLAFSSPASLRCFLPEAP